MASYVPEGSGRVVAFDAVSGEVVWIHERKFPDDVATSEAFPRTRGVSILGNTLYWGTADSYLVALDARSGKMMWETKTGDYRVGEGHNHPPLIAEGKVFLGQAGRSGAVESSALTPNRAACSGRSTPHRVRDPGYDTWTKRDVPPLGGAVEHGELRP
jgi:alcohol dehydrogenase (cytochrome c)